MQAKLTLIAFLAMSLVQLYVPARLIFSKENILTTGKAFKFRTAPIDPHDPFRGKYIVLNFADNSFQTAQTDEWQHGDDIYVSITTDSEGFAKIASLSKRKPETGEEYILATVQHMVYDSMNTVFVQFPFDRFYMEETKAPVAEQAYNEAAMDSNMITYALVYVRNGDAVIQDVRINEISVQDLRRE